jgi:hypothetical protein
MTTDEWRKDLYLPIRVQSRPDRLPRSAGAAMMDTREAVARAMCRRAIWNPVLTDVVNEHRVDGRWIRWLDDADIAIAAHLKALAAEGWTLLPPNTQPTRPFTPADVRDHRDRFGSGLREAYDACQGGYRAMIQEVDNG